MYLGSYNICCDYFVPIQLFGMIFGVFGLAHEPLNYWILGILGAALNIAERAVVLVIRSYLWQRQYRTAEAIDLLQPVYDWFSDVFGTPDLTGTKALLKELNKKLRTSILGYKRA